MQFTFICIQDTGTCLLLNNASNVQKLLDLNEENLNRTLQCETVLDKSPKQSGTKTKARNEKHRCIKHL